MAPALSHLLATALASAALLACAQVPGKHFDRIMIINFENQAYEDVIQNPDFLAMAKRGRILTNYYAITHPSQPNYMCQVSGATYVTDDSNHDVEACNIADLLDAKHITWKAYQEDFPGNCFTGKSSGKYYRKHNPLISFTSIHNNASRCAHIVEAGQLQKDLASRSLPQFLYYTPNIDNDGHNTNIPFAGKYLTSFLLPLLDDSYFTTGTLIVITWDEDDDNHKNHIYTALLGKGVLPGSSDATHYTHYSLLRTVEDNWGLGSCNRNDTTATPYALN
eukprot:TRINITY_DN27813_c0_g1_i1.p1 TRINITY_DN27813_c0_g1~~TRINITY_DN27813_c0_g1_i1.p1  ORF type:complete len:287 (+),score=79.60 TRINITY_DN27813_c0_g1_i1:29-862(+)